MSQSTRKSAASPAESSRDVSNPPTFVWQQLGNCLEAFSVAWDQAAEPPSLQAHLPESPRSLRWLALVELIKLDLERRWTRPEWRWRLEQYV